MKLKEILSEDYGDWQKNRTQNANVGGGNITSTGMKLDILGGGDSYQHNNDIDLVTSIAGKGDDGFDDKLTYIDKNRAKNMTQAGILDLHDGKYYITQTGRKWLDAFQVKYSDVQIQSAVPKDFSGVGGGSIVASGR